MRPSGRVQGIVLLVLALLAMVMATYSGLQSASYARCQASVNEALVRAQVARGEAAEQDRQSDREESAATAALIRAVFTPGTSASRMAAYERYRATVDAINERRAVTEEQRQANPLPAPPSQTC